MPMYRKKNSEVEAIQWNGSNWHAMLEFVKWRGGIEIFPKGEVLQIADEQAGKGDWIVRHADGVYAIYDNGEFDEQYELKNR